MTTASEQVPFNKPYLTGRELSFISEAHLGGQLSGAGRFTRLCETWLESLGGSPRALLTHSGDIVKEIDGKLHFLGRKDNQIKHMGYRIELEEIENALVRLPQVDQAAVVYLRTQAAYGRLVAYVACTVEADDRQLLRELSKLLPDYMVPTKLIILPQLPKNANGKVDRQQLRSF